MSSLIKRIAMFHIHLGRVVRPGFMAFGIIRLLEFAIGGTK